MRGRLERPARFAGGERVVGWQGPSEVHWHEPIGSLAKVERCAGKDGVLTPSSASTCTILKYLVVLKVVDVSYGIQQTTGITPP